MILVYPMETCSVKTLYIVYFSWFDFHLHVYVKDGVLETGFFWEKNLDRTNAKTSLS